MSIICSLEVFQTSSSIFQRFGKSFFVESFCFADDGSAIWELGFGIIGMEAVDNMGPHVPACGGVWKIGTLSEKSTVQEDCFLMVIDSSRGLKRS